MTSQDQQPVPGSAVGALRLRRWFGVALLLLDAVLVWQSVTNDTFRFVWHADEGELLLLEVAVCLVGLVLLASSVQPAGPVTGGRHWLGRAAPFPSGGRGAGLLGLFLG